MRKYIPQDITLLLIASEDDINPWSQEMMLSVAGQLMELLPDYIFDWDEGAGEEWAIFDSNKSSMVAISRSKPLSLITDFDVPPVLRVLENHGVKIIASRAWDDDSIVFDFSQYQRETPKWLTRAESTMQSNGGLMSLHDFWLSTI